MSIRSVLITGANRGIGLEFVRQFLALQNPPEYVIATCRNPDHAEVRVTFDHKAPSSIEKEKD